MKITPDIIMEYGIFVVIAAIFLSMNLLMFKSQQKRQQVLEEKQTELVSKQEEKNEELLGLLLREMKSGRHSADKEEVINKIEKNINVLLKDLLFATNAGRAYFVRYHNGGHDLNEMSFLKMSMTNEVTRKGVANAMNNFVNQFRSIFSWLIEAVDTGSPIHIDDMEKLKNVSHSLYDYLLDQNVKRCHGIGIKNKKSQTIGFIAISYLVDERYLENDQIEEHLKTQRIKLETILNCDFD